MSSGGNNFSENTSNSSYHIPIMLNEVISFLKIREGGIYVDCTFGGGGHSMAILDKIGNGKLIVFDQDQDAIKNVPDDQRIIFIPQNFRYLQKFLRLNGISEVDGILADLGVSSHQFDEGARGFSIRSDAKLDMRMDQRQDKTAVDVLNKFSELQLHKLFEKYGEVTNAKTLARAIVEKRKTKSIESIDEFKSAISNVVKGNPNKYFAQVFQALRIEVNDELMSLREMLEQVPTVLNRSGRVVILTFHSIEDRIVKTFFKKGEFDEMISNPYEQEIKSNLLKIVTKKPVEASDDEKRLNPRSRSAKLRVAEKI